MNCVDVCPKGLNPTKAIGKIKRNDGSPRGGPVRTPALNRPQWRCTCRALLDADLILGKFLDEGFPGSGARRGKVSPCLRIWKITTSGLLSERDGGARMRGRLLWWPCCVR